MAFNQRKMNFSKIAYFVLTNKSNIRKNNFGQEQMNNMFRLMAQLF